MSELNPTLQLRVRQYGAVVEVRLANDSKRNALTHAMLTGLADLLTCPPDGTRVIVLTGGAHFSAGADISVYAAHQADAIENLTSTAARVCETMTASPIPIIAAVEGVALGGGFELVLAADLVIACTAASFGLPETALGLIPGWGGTQRLTAQVGPRRAKQMIMLAERLGADQAAALGLVNEVVPEGQALPRALELAQRLQHGSAAAIAATKTLVHAAQHPLALEAERATLRRLFTSPDGIEGVTAFVEKRSPDFTRRPGRSPAA